MDDQGQPGVTASSVSALVSDAEAWAIVERQIAPQFSHYVDQYDTGKYPPAVYNRVRVAFEHPAFVTPGTLREALLWKYGHLGKPAIPAAHERLIAAIQSGWPAVAAVLPGVPGGDFLALDRAFGGRTRFITIAFLLHLLHPREVPIIDQHNFRAANALMSRVKEGWHSRRAPSRYEDIGCLAAFMGAILASWSRHAPDSVPSARDLDRFLMMYGKDIKRVPREGNERMGDSERRPAIGVRRIGLVGCVKEKAAGRRAAKDLYLSTLFAGRRAFVERSCGEWWVLSAKHGLVHPDEEIDTYDVALKDAGRDARREWSRGVLAAIDQRVRPAAGQVFEVHAGSEYRDFGVEDGLKARGCVIENPTEGMRFGEQLQFYTQARWGRP